MRRVALLTAVLSLGLTAPAAAWVELPPYPIPHDGVADCLRAAGPGQLALLGALGRRTSATDLLTVGPGGIARKSSTTLGWLIRCAEVGTAPGVSPLLAAPVVANLKRGDATMRAAAAGAAPATLGRRAEYEPSPSVAVAPNGAAVVAWLQLTETKQFFVGRMLAAVRPAGSARFGPAVTLGTGSDARSAPTVGIDASGSATVAWLSRAQPRGGSLLKVASVTADGRFGSSQAVASADGQALELAVSAGGRLLIANYGGDSDAITAYERAPGATTFAPVVVPTTGSPSNVAIALADDGSAVLAYRKAGPAVVALVRRRPDGTFGGEQLLDGKPTRDDSSSYGPFGGPVTPRPAPPVDFAGARIVLALGTDGRVLATWVDPSDRHGAASAHVARGTLTTGMRHATRLGSPCRAANAARPLTLTDGTLEVAWTDNARVLSRGNDDEPLGGGRLHVLGSGPAPRAGTTASPGLAARLLGPRALHGNQGLHLRVRCRRGPCVVRAVATSYGLGMPDEGPAEPIASSTELRRDQSAVLTLPSSTEETFAPAGRAPATISLLACPLTGRGATRLALHERLRRLPLRPLPRILDLVARRHGSSIHVTWRTSIPTRDASFAVEADPSDDGSPYAELDGHGRSRFSVTLHGSASRTERTVDVSVGNDDQSGEPMTTRIR